MLCFLTEVRPRVELVARKRRPRRAVAVPLPGSLGRGSALALTEGFPPLLVDLRDKKRIFVRAAIQYGRFTVDITICFRRSASSDLDVPSVRYIGHGRFGHPDSDIEKLTPFTRRRR